MTDIQSAPEAAAYPGSAPADSQQQQEDSPSATAYPTASYVQNGGGDVGQPADATAQAGAVVEFEDKTALPADYVYAEDLVKKNPDLERFKQPKFNDLWGSAIFAIVVVLLVVFGSMNASKGKLDGTNSVTVCDSTASCITLSGAMIKGSAIAFGYALAISGCMLMLWRFNATWFIKASLAFEVILCILIAVLTLTLGGSAISAGIYFGFAGLIILYFLLVRHVIPFTGLISEISIAWCQQLWGVFVALFGCFCLYTVLFAFWMMVAIPVFDTINTGDDVAFAGGISFLLLWCYFFIGQICMGLLHVIVSGSIATYYFCGEPDNPVAELPEDITLASAKRALGPSFGSICGAAIILSFVKTLEFIINVLVDDSDLHPVVKCIIKMIVRCITRLLEVVNDVALSAVAVYGLDLMSAAEKGITLVRSGRMHAVTHECLLDTCVFMLNLATASFVAVCTWITLDYSWPALVVGAQVGYITSAMVNFVPGAGVTALIVCMNDADDVFYAKHPKYADRMREVVHEMETGFCRSCRE